MPKKHYLTLAAAAMLGMSSFSSALAGTETAAPGKESKTVTPPCPVSYITGDFGVTFVSEYISRGILQEDKGVIAEPYLDLYIKLYTGTGFIDAVSAQLSFWSDIASNHGVLGSPGSLQYHHLTGPATSLPDWYEFDWDPGISVTFAQKFTLLVQYFEFDSPAGAFNTARSIDANLTYDDSAIMGPFSLHPHLTVLYELGGGDGPASTTGGAAGLKKDGWYEELGVAPSYTFLPKSTYPITLALPLTVGLSGQSGFYYHDWFGYFSGGPTLSVPLAFIPSGFGSWTLTAGYTYYKLGNDVRLLSSPGNVSNRNVWSGAIGCTF
jgi:hypothetical protein